MPTAQSHITFDVSQVVGMLEQYPLKAHQALWKGVKAATKPLIQAAKKEVRQPGMSGYHEQTGGRRPISRRDKPLKNTIGSVVREYRAAKASKIVAVVGPQYPAGAHGHLVEHGHRIAQGGTLRRIKSVSRSSSGGGIKAGTFPSSTRRAQLFRRHRSGQGRSMGMTREFPFLAPASITATGKMQSVLIETVRVDLAK